MEALAIKSDLWFCTACGRHYRGNRRRCPTDDTLLETAPPFDGRPGDMVDERYRLVSQLGVGGMGTVWRAYDAVTQRDVALKVLNREYAAHAASAKRFLNEARIMRQVRHSNVVQMHRFGRTKAGLLFIDMELVNGPNMHQQLTAMRRPLGFRQGLKLIDSLLAALASCHSAGVVHCDVKPENVVAFQTHRVKLLDFGIAQTAGPLAQSDDLVVLGTPAFISPEQVRGGHIDARTDLYLTGCLAFELLAGRPPFDHDDPVQLCQAQLHQQAPKLSEFRREPLPAGLEAWVAQLLEKDPTKRPQSARIARETLRRIRRGDSGSLRPPVSHRLMVESERVAAAYSRLEQVRSHKGMAGLRCLIEARQTDTSTMAYGSEALEQLLRGVAGGFLADMRDMNALIRGPRGPYIEVTLKTGGDERGVIVHLLDCIADLNTALERVQEPKLQVRAAIRSVPDLHVERVQPRMLEMRPMLHVGGMSHVRVDEHVARWAGRRPIVKLDAHQSGPLTAGEQLYATALFPV